MKDVKLGRKGDRYSYGGWIVAYIELRMRGPQTMYVASDIIIEQGMEWIYTSRYLRWKNKNTTTFHVNSVSFSDTWIEAGLM